MHLLQLTSIIVDTLINTSSAFEIDCSDSKHRIPCNTVLLVRKVKTCLEETNKLSDLFLNIVTATK